MGKVPDGDLLGTPYQLEKHIKHTVPDAKYDVQSVFNNTSTQVYATSSSRAWAPGRWRWTRAAGVTSSGSQANRPGMLHRRGAPKLAEDSVKVVLTTSTGEIHAFPVSSTGTHSVTCSDCGRLAVS
jgi:hypothetical protein